MASQQEYSENEFGKKCQYKKEQLRAVAKTKLPRRRTVSMTLSAALRAMIFAPSDIFCTRVLMLLRTQKKHDSNARRINSSTFSE
jgi:hypothetical protein